MLIPLKAIQELRRICDEALAERRPRTSKDVARPQLQITQSGSSAFFQGAGMTFSVKLVDAQFPPYAQVIPQNSERKIRAPRAAFADALRAVSIAASERTGGVKVTLAQGDDAHHQRIARERRRIRRGSVDYDGPELTIGFNAKYFLDVLGALEEDEVILGLSGELDPGGPSTGQRSAVPGCRHADAHLTQLRRRPSRARARDALFRAFRNLEAVDLEPGARFNVISGDNGQGKTNLLEGIYVLATSRSFRQASLATWFVTERTLRASERHRARGRRRSRAERRSQAGRARGADRWQATRLLATYAVRTPVVVFHPGEVALSMGSGAERRRLLDRIALFVQATSMDELERYGRAMRERQRALETRGIAASDVVHWEALMVRHGLAVMDVRSEAALLLAAAAEPAFARIAAPGLALSVRYSPGASRDAEEFGSTLAASRAVDQRRGGSRFGPHRDELVLSIGERPVRGVASQGQHRAVVLALKSAEVQVVGAARGSRPILLLDDVSSELDRDRTAALFAFLREQRGQVFLTTTRPELIAIDRAERMDLRVVSGSICRE